MRVGVEILSHGFVGNGYKLGFQNLLQTLQATCNCFLTRNTNGRFLNPYCGFGDVSLVFADDFMILFSVIRIYLTPNLWLG